MRRNGKLKEDREWLVRLGKQIEDLIRKRGYKSPYDFWINQAGDDISRSTLNYILKGRVDPKATTLRVLAKLLAVKPSKLIDLE